jgi:hypothetical protein
MRRLVLLVLLGLAGCTSGGTLPIASFSPSVTPGSYSPPASPGAGAVPGVPAASATPLQTAPDVPRVTGILAAGSCHYRSTAPELPDPRCTPGSYDPALTAKIICATGYDVEKNRPPTGGTYGTTRAKYDVAYPAYGVPQGTPTEFDHLISRGLGGNNTMANLWPESPPTPNAKDAVESHLRHWVCNAEHAGNDALAEGRLAAARQAIAYDWITAVQVLGAFS